MSVGAGKDIPIAATPASNPAPVSAPAAMVNASRILVVEDNPVNQKVLFRMLGQRGHLVDIAASGHEAVLAVHRVTYDAVLMDCQMPDLDGYQATEEIRRWEQTQPRADGLRRLPIIAVTASATNRDRERCIAAGMDDYLSKPIDVATLDRSWGAGCTSSRLRRDGSRGGDFWPAGRHGPRLA